MSEDSLSILCGQTWHWDSRDENQIIFGDNGIGKLICRSELNVWIAAEFDWKLLGIGKNDQQNAGERRWWSSGLASGGGGTETRLMLEIALAKRRIANLGDAEMSRYKINEEVLTDEAFLPKKFVVTLQSGKFKTQFDALGKTELPGTPRFGFRLVFDQSPYPRRNQWREPDGAPDAMKFWEWTEFCGGEIK
ncbi:hypothetical protein EsH8_VII_000159 [Colletotrichum jinshuiense]